MYREPDELMEARIEGKAWVNVYAKTQLIAVEMATTSPVE